MKQTKGTKKKVMAWSVLPLAKPILQSLAEHSLEKPMPIQAKALKAALIDGKHVLGAAKTGSGKTLAYAIPIVNQILDPNHATSTSIRRQINSHNKNQDQFKYSGENIECISEGDIVDLEEVEDETIQDQEDNSADSDSNSDELDSNETSIGLEAIILVPTRELATQVKGEIDKIIKFTQIKACCLIGGMNQDKQLRVIKTKQPQIVVATPGRLYEIIQSNVSEHLSLASVGSINTLVIDEADRMTQRGHFEEMNKIIDIIKEAGAIRSSISMPPCRVYLYSATLTFLHELPDRLKGVVNQSKMEAKNKKKHKGENKKIEEQTKVAKLKQLIKLLGLERNQTRVIDLTIDGQHGRPGADQLTELKVNCCPQDKDFYLYYFLLHHRNGRVLVFCNSKDCLRRLTNVLKWLQIEALALHADMDQKKRLKALDRFRSKQNSVLIATDVAARGLDVKDLDYVVHYQVPKTCESYIHRSGRTARVNNKGLSLTLCEPAEIPLYRRLCNSINNGKDLADYEIDTTLRFVIKDRVVLAQECDKLDHRLREDKSEKNWFLKAASACDIELDEDDLRRINKGKDFDQQRRDEVDKQRRLSKLSSRLNSLLRQPLKSRSGMIIERAQRLSSIKSQ